MQTSIYRLMAAVAARQMRGSHDSLTQAHLKLKQIDFRARERGHFGASLVFWLQELEESEAPVHAVLRDPHPVTYSMKNSPHLVIL